MPQVGTSIPKSLDAREAFFLDQVKSGTAEYDWHPITISNQDHSITVYVLGDALKVLRLQHGHKSVKLGDLAATVSTPARHPPCCNRRGLR